METPQYTSSVFKSQTLLKAQHFSLYHFSLPLRNPGINFIDSDIRQLHWLSWPDQ